MSHFGEVVKIIRKSKNLSMKEVVGDKLSIAQLSRFERGESNMTVDNFYYIMQRMKVSLEEFITVYNNYSSSEHIKFINKAATAYLNNDLRTLKELQLLEEEKLKKDSDDKFLKLDTILIKALIFTLDNQYTVPKKDIDYLVDYLFSVDEWGRYELVLFSNTTLIIPIKTLEMLALEIIKKTQFYSQIDENRKLVYVTVINVTSTCIFLGHLSTAMKFIHYLNRLNIPETDLYGRMFLKYLEALYSYKVGNKAKKMELEKIVSILEYLECSGTASKLSHEIANL